MKRIRERMEKKEIDHRLGRKYRNSRWFSKNDSKVERKRVTFSSGEVKSSV